MEQELFKKTKQYVCTTLHFVVMDYCGENSLKIVRSLTILQPIMWPLVKQLFISPPLWSICYRPSIFCVCVCLYVCVRHPTVPQPRGRLVV